jgi:hypothetical protein
MQKHLQTFEFNGYTASAASTNYFIPAAISINTGPFNHNVNAGASGTTALIPTVLLERWEGYALYWNLQIMERMGMVSGSGAVNISIFKYTPVAGVIANPVSLVLVKEFYGYSSTNPELIAIMYDEYYSLAFMLEIY